MPIQPRLFLLTPVLAEPGGFTARLAAACAAGEVAAVLLRLAPADPRTLTNRVKEIAPAAQEHGAAVILAVPAGMAAAEAATIAARGGADGLHLAGIEEAAEIRRQLGPERSLGIGRLKTKHDAMSAGEAGADYVLFGEPRPDDSLPDLDAVEERAAWWAEIFETPCVAYAPDLEAVARLREAGVDFVALGRSVWDAPDGEAACRAALAVLAAAPEEVA